MKMGFVSHAVTASRRPRRSRVTCSDSPVPWKSLGAIEGDPNAKKWRVKLTDPKDGKEYVADVPEDRYILYYLNEQGLELPASCRNGCCTTCAAKIDKGEVFQPEALGLLKEMKDQDYALMCVSYPRSDIEAVLQDEDEVYVKQFGSSFESGGVVSGGVLIDED